jgi:hypothetical protein
MKPVFGWNVAKRAQMAIPQFKASCIRHCDKAIYRLEAPKESLNMQAMAAAHKD